MFNEMGKPGLIEYWVIVIVGRLGEPPYKTKYKYIMKIRKIFILFFILNAGVIKAQSQTLADASPFNTAYTRSILYQAAKASQVSFSSASLQEALEMQTERHGLEKTGRVLTFIGVPLLIIGGVMVANSDGLYYNCTNGVCDGDAQGGFGVVLLGSGIGLTGTGIVLWAIGSKRTKRMNE